MAKFAKIFDNLTDQVLVVIGGSEDHSGFPEIRVTSEFHGVLMTEHIEFHTKTKNKQDAWDHAFKMFHAIDVNHALGFRERLRKEYILMTNSSDSQITVEKSCPS